MRSKRKKIKSIPHEFTSYEDAAEFWEIHDTTEYDEIFHTVKNVHTEFRRRHYEIELDEDVAKIVKEEANKLGVSISYLVSEILRRQLSHVA